MNEHPPDTERGSSARGEVERIELDRQHATFARKMAESKATAPHVYLGAEAEMTRALELIAAGEVAVRDLILRASALALRELPRANGAYRDGAVELYSRINPCFAVTAESGVIYPTVFDADTKSLDEIAGETRNLSKKVLDGSITAPDLSGSTFTLQALDTPGVDRFTPILNPPHAATLGTGSVEARPVARADGSVEARPTITLDLACDSRIIGGAEGATFLARVRSLVEDPTSL